MTDPVVDPAPQENPAPGQGVRFESVTMDYGNRSILDSLTCRFAPGQITVILGGSGSGKSTTLRLIGGLIRPDRGKILVDGEDVVGMSESQLCRVRLKLGMMFQDGALLDSVNVFDNLALPLREHTDQTEVEIRQRVFETIVNVGLQTEDRFLFPSELSGGMVKRVALARAIIMKPIIVLCDEPFSGLDPINAKRIELLLQRLNSQFGMTLIVVSHDSMSTMRMADHVLILLPERSVEGDPKELVKGEDPTVTHLLSGDVDESMIQLDRLLESGMIPTKGLTSTWS